MYGDDYHGGDFTVQLARSLRLIHPCSVEVWVFQWFIGFYPLSSLHDILGHLYFTLDAYISAISSQSLTQKSATRDHLFVILP